MTKHRDCADRYTAFSVHQIPSTWSTCIHTEFTVKLKAGTVLTEQPFHNRARHSGGTAPHVPKLSTWWNYLASFSFCFISVKIHSSTPCFGNWVDPRYRFVANRKDYDPSRDRNPISRSSIRCLVTTFIKYLLFTAVQTTNLPFAVQNEQMVVFSLLSWCSTQ